VRRVEGESREERRRKSKGAKAHEQGPLMLRIACQCAEALERDSPDRGTRAERAARAKISMYRLG